MPLQAMIAHSVVISSTRTRFAMLFCSQIHKQCLVQQVLHTYKTFQSKCKVSKKLKLYMCTKGNLHMILKELLFTNLFRILLPRRIHAVKLPFILLHLISCVEHNVKCSHGVTARTTLNSKQFISYYKKIAVASCEHPYIHCTHCAKSFFRANTPMNKST